jgi:VWFA-related protein
MSSSGDIRRVPELRHLASRIAGLSLVAAALLVSPARLGSQDHFRFRSGIELVNVTATVTDQAGRFVSGLTQGDFIVYEDDRPVEIAHFNAERVPVSLGILLDTSASMQGGKMIAAQVAVRRLLFELLGPDDEVFLYRFSDTARLLQGWSTDRNRLSTELGRIRPEGGTALYDGVAAALPLLKAGRHRKKALLVVSDGIDTASKMDLPGLKTLIRESEALVYAIGIDEQSTVNRVDSRDHSLAQGAARYQRRRPPISVPFPTPFQRPPRRPPVPGIPGSGVPPRMPTPNDPWTSGAGVEEDSLNETALHDITDDSGGGTQIVRGASDLGGATSRIADELSKQYFLGYKSPGHRDGRWHTIRVEVRGQSLNVRARRGYIASP